MTLEPDPAVVPTAAPVAGGLPPVLADKLRDPAVAASLAGVLEHADLLALIVTSLDGLVARSDVIGDSLISGIAELRGAGSSPDAARLGQSLSSLASALPRLASTFEDLARSGALDRLLASGILAPDVVDELGQLGAGFARGARQFRTDPVNVTGSLSLFRLLRDPDVTRALGFFATIAKVVGRDLAAPPHRRAPSSSPDSH